MRTRAPLASLLLLAACPEQVGQQCPPKTVAVGTYALAFTPQHDAGECIATVGDGGQTKLALDDAGTRGGTICVGTASDGGPQLYLVVAGKGARPSDLLDDGGFHFTGQSDPTSGTACPCPIGIDESFDGFLQTSGQFTLQPDGGLPLVTGLSGTLVDRLTTPQASCTSGDAGCNVPCPVTYGIVGTRF